MKIFRVLSSEYRDSLFLMKVSTDVSRWPGVKQAVIVMGTESNRRILQQVGLNSEDTDLAGANDLVIAIELENQSNSNDILHKLDILLATGEHDEKAKDSSPDLTTVLSKDPEINLVAISTPGDVAVAMAREAIDAGKHVFCFSHHISVESEIELKDLAISKKLLMMGPDCGTSIIDGVGLGFANKVRKGSIGIVSASGSGLQEVISLIHRSGAGISQAIGVGGRDLTSPIDGRMAEQALLRVAHLPQTDVILLLAKKVSTGAEQRLFKTIRKISKPIVTQLQGLNLETEQSEGNNPPIIAETYEECAKFAVLLSGGKWLIRDNRDHLTRWMEEVLPSLDPERRSIRGLYAGGSLCGEANQILTSCGFAVCSNLMKPIEETGKTHMLLDLGAEEYTEGRVHPFVDHRLRDLEIEKAFLDPTVGILLVDVVLGWGCHPDPAAELIHSLEKAKSKYGRGPVIIASVCGTSDDFQNYDNQREKLTNYGIFVAESNAAAARLARDIVIFKHLNKNMATYKPKLYEAIIHGRLHIANVGLQVFVEGAEEAGAKVIPARWSPYPIVSEDIKSLLDGLL